MTACREGYKNLGDWPGANRIIWDEPLTQALIALRAQGKAWTAVADRLGVGVASAHRKAIALGLAWHR